MAQGLTLEQAKALGFKPQGITAEEAAAQGFKPAPAKPEAPPAVAPTTAEPSLPMKALTGIRDVFSGIDNAGMSALQASGQWLEHLAGMKVSPPRMDAKGRETLLPTNTAQKVGSMLGKTALGVAGAAAGGPALAGQVAAGGLSGALLSPDEPLLPASLGMAGPIVAKGVGTAIKALPSKARAGGKFNAIDKAAGKIPINTAAADAVAARAEEMSTRGASLPKVIKDYIKERDANPIMNYEVGRDFAKNSGRLSGKEKLKANKEMKMQVGKFYNAMKTANREAADKVGMGEAYDAAINEFRRASTIDEAAKVAIKWAKRAAVVAALGAAGGAGFDLYQKMTK